MFHFDRDFVDRNGERYMLPIRIQSLMKRLWSRYILKKEYSGGDFLFTEKDVPFSQLHHYDDWTLFKAGETVWGKPDQFVWFRQTIVIPDDFQGNDVWYTVYPYNEDSAWPWGQPQIQMFVNGKCICGLDNNHRSCLIVKNAEGGETLEIAMKAYSDLTYFRSRMTMRSVLQVFRPEIYEFYRTIEVLLRSVALFSSDSIERPEIITRLNDAVNMLDMDEAPDSKQFTDSLKIAEAYLDRELFGAMYTGKEPVLWSIGHTHIDVAWQWTYRITRNKAARSFASILRLMDQNEDFLFMSSQPQLYEFVKQDEPEVYENIHKRVKEGRWEPEGGMWVEADTNLTSGESLVRQFLYGKRFFKKEFGVDCEILWLPDVFGYSANLPQICRKSGIKYFYTTKISWNEYDKFPYDTFRWRGLDGSTLLSHFGCAIRYTEHEGDWLTSYNPTMEPEYVLGAWQRYQQKDINRDILYDYGFGDGGGGPTQEMIDHARRFAKKIPGCPIVRFAKAGDFFRHLEENVSEHPRLPEWCGEMYLEFHRGTYTSQALVKKNNRLCETLYHDIENLWSFDLLTGGNAENYPSHKLEENWKLILLNQFHDVLPGSSIHQVYEDARAYHEKVLSEGLELQKEAVRQIVGKIKADSESAVVFNTLSFERTPIVFLDTFIQGLLDSKGEYIPCQRTHDGKTVFAAPKVPAKGWKSFRICESRTNKNQITVSEHYIETPALRVSFDEHMHITSLYSKTAGRESIPQGSIGGRLIAFEDVPPKDDAWNVQAYYREKYAVIDDVQSVQILETGPVRCVVRVLRKFRNSTIQTDIIAYACSDQLQFDYEIDWHERDLFVKAEYPVDVNAERAAYDIQFGFIERPVHTNTLWDFARFEVCGQKWADVSDRGFGLAILSDCKYGFSAERNSLSISLLKCSTYPDKEQDQGIHRFSYAIYPHAGDQIQGHVKEHGYDFNFKPIAGIISGNPSGKLPEEKSLFRIDVSNVVIEAIKKAEDSDDIILRLYEAENKSTVCHLHTGFCIGKLAEGNLMEEPGRELTADDNSAELHFKPFEIKTLILQRKGEKI